MKSHRHDQTAPTDENVLDLSGENWDSDVIELLLKEGDSRESVMRPDEPANISTHKENDLSRANLNGANLSEAHLNGAEMTLAQLSHAELRHAHLAGANLSYANLQGAHLENIDLKKADLSYADLSLADLRGAHMQHANLESADLRAADLRGAHLGTAKLAHTKVYGAIFDEQTYLPFERSEAISRGMVFMETDSMPDIEVASGNEQES